MVAKLAEKGMAKLGEHQDVTLEASRRVLELSV
jgi:alcohol dehydrogenase YqhD (iron-dependent ADH family)